MKRLFLITVAAISSLVVSAQTKWNLDPTHSSVKFSVEHLVISEVEGSFKKFDGNVNSAKPALQTQPLILPLMLTALIQTTTSVISI
jgi:polyisoprenoid-binding protein YceI